MNVATGFVLTEALVVVLIVAICTAFAIPAFRDARLDAQRSREVTAWVQSIHLARAEAIKRNAVVSICPSADGHACSTGAGDWTRGRLVFANLAVEQPPVRSADEPIVHVHGAWPGGRITSNRDWLSFRAYGQSGVTATIVFCDARGAADARAVIVSQSGRPRVSTTRSSGEPLACD